MTVQFPMRPSAHQIEDESIVFFSRHLPIGWTCDRPQHDYGVDLRVGLATDGMINGQQLVVQLKASAEAANGDSVLLVTFILSQFARQFEWFLKSNIADIMRAVALHNKFD